MALKIYAALITLFLVLALYAGLPYVVLYIISMLYPGGF